MQWVTQYGVWIVLVIGIWFLFSRRMHGGGVFGCGGHAKAHDDHPGPNAAKSSADPIDGKPVDKQRHRHHGC